jgi:hypothetical protein
MLPVLPNSQRLLDGGIPPDLWEMQAIPKKNKVSGTIS